MIPLATRGASLGLTERRIGKVTLTSQPLAVRGEYIRVVKERFLAEDLGGYQATVFDAALPHNATLPAVYDCPVSHLLDGDIIAIDPGGHVRTLIRNGSRSNTLFATDRCNSLCIMCSQPPKEVDDSKNADELIRIVSLIDPDTAELGITGGEPTLLGNGLLRVIDACRTHLPRTDLHLLSNGRRLADIAYARDFAAVSHPRLMVGIPLYSDIDSLHDYVVQARGAFDETVLGIQNLGLHNVAVEIRVVVQRQTIERLLPLAAFIYRNFTFASHVAFMGLEITGFAKAHIDELWADPKTYMPQLAAAVEFLTTRGLRVSIYNHQLCKVTPSLWSYCRASISDWKNEFPDECAPCDVREKCGGFFTWNLGFSQARQVSPVKLLPQH